LIGAKAYVETAESVHLVFDSTDFVFAKIQRSERRQSAPGRIAGVEAL